MNSNWLIRYDSKYFNKEYFKSFNDDHKMLIKNNNNNYLEYISSPYDRFLTFKVNATKRMLIYRKNIKNILIKEFNYLPAFQEIIDIILNYVGYNIDDVYISLNVHKNPDYKALIYNCWR